MMFKLLAKVPVLGDLLRIFNAYAYRGDARADEKFANFWLWVSGFGIELAISSLGTILAVPVLVNSWLPQHYQLTYQVDLVPGPLATSILPNLLGFGIGIYALIFGLHKMLLRELQDGFSQKIGEKRPPNGSALILNAEMAVPLVVLAITIIIGVIQQMFPSSLLLQASSWFSLWLSLLFTLELISTLFGLGENSILKALKSDEPR